MRQLTFFYLTAAYISAGCGRHHPTATLDLNALNALPVAEGDYPFAAQISLFSKDPDRFNDKLVRVKLPDGQLKFHLAQCSGSFITPRTLLTTRHCLEFDSGATVDLVVLASTNILGEDKSTLRKYIHSSSFSFVTSSVPDDRYFHEHDMALVHFPNDVATFTVGLGHNIAIKTGLSISGIGYGCSTKECVELAAKRRSERDFLLRVTDDFVEDLLKRRRAISALSKQVVPEEPPSPTTPDKGLRSEKRSSTQDPSSNPPMYGWEKAQAAKMSAMNFEHDADARLFASLLLTSLDAMIYRYGRYQSIDRNAGLTSVEQRLAILSAKAGAKKIKRASEDVKEFLPEALQMPKATMRDIPFGSIPSNDRSRLMRCDQIVSKKKNGRTFYANTPKDLTVAGCSFQPGDSGGPVVAGQEIVGVLSAVGRHGSLIARIDAQGFYDLLVEAVAHERDDDLKPLLENFSVKPFVPDPNDAISEDGFIPIPKKRSPRDTRP